MRVGFYPKLALNGIRKNKRLYLPYILTGSLMVMMFYIMSFLAESPSLSKMSGGSVLRQILPLGSVIIGIFSLLFLFYTNSFLIRQRYREFGLYNILGMDKRNISRIMIWESLMVGAAAIMSGLLAGIVLSKAAELVLLNLLHMEVTFKLAIGARSLSQTAIVYGIIYLLLLCNSLIKVKRSKPLELMQSGRVGERIPKRIWINAIAGISFLAIAYYLAVSIEEPLTALVVFFIAVVLVIGATYLLFMSGSVVLCRLLQRNKRYYYKPNHFVSVSSMVYRMRRNGAGLASICILLTMVLVMISSTASLYFGSEDSIHSRYPNGVNITVTVDDINGFGDEDIAILQDIVEEKSGNKEIGKYFRTGEVAGLFTGDGIIINHNSVTSFDLSTYDNVGYLQVIPLEDYNRMTGLNETLGEDECMLYCIRTEYTSDTFAVANGKPYKVKKVLKEFFSDGELNMLIVPSICLVVDDFDAFVEPILPQKAENGSPMLQLEWKCGFDMESPESEIAAADAIKDAFHTLHIEGSSSISSYNVESREENREDFFHTFGSLFFLGIMLSIVFILAAVLIIYYKQISEGYEDKSRFDIMQKVGMTKRDIRKNINSQVITVFFSPLALAGIHLAFAFPFVWKMLMLFNLRNMPLVIVSTLICFAIFGLFYALVYKITSNTYYGIVSGGKDKV